MMMMDQSNNLSDSDEQTTASSLNSIAFDEQEIDFDLPDTKWQLQALENKYRTLIKLIVSGKSKISTIKSPQSVLSCTTTTTSTDTGQPEIGSESEGQQFSLENFASSMADGGDASQIDQTPMRKRGVITLLSDDELKIKLLDKLCRVQVKLNELIEREAFSLDENQTTNSMNGVTYNNLIASCNGHKFVNSSQFNSIGYLTSLSPYIKAVISNKLFSFPGYLLLTASGYVENLPAIMPSVGRRSSSISSDSGSTAVATPTDHPPNNGNNNVQSNTPNGSDHDCRQLDPFNFSASNSSLGASNLHTASTMCDCCGKRINRFGYSALSNLTSAVIRPLASSLNSSSYSTSGSNGLLTCEYCFYQIHESCFERATGTSVSNTDKDLHSRGHKSNRTNNRKQPKQQSHINLTRVRPCPKILFDQYDLPNYQFIFADQVLKSQERLKNIDCNDYSATKLVDTSGLSDIDEQVQSDLSDARFPPDTPKLATVASPSIDCPSILRKVNSSSSLSVKSSVSEQQQETMSPLLPIGQYTGELLIMRICPETGLHSQDFSCADCDMPISLLTSRLCHYDGKYYCFKCHTGDEMTPIPARIIRNWDFTPKPVSRTSWHKICFIRTRPILFNLFEMNSMLYGFIDRLVDIKQVRESLKSMLNYLRLCGQPQKPKLSSVPAHFLNDDLINYYSLNDLLNIQQVYDSLCSLQSALERHIVKGCESCLGKGFFCELCKDEDDVLFPFSKNAVSCAKCSAVYHKNCYNRKKKNCPKCIRLSNKKRQLENI